MRSLKQYAISTHGSLYAASRAWKIAETQLRRLVAKNALVDDTGAIWIKSKTEIKG